MTQPRHHAPSTRRRLSRALPLSLLAVAAVGLLPLAPIAAAPWAPTAAAATDPDADGKFTIAVYPDTQQLVVEPKAVSSKLFKSASQWLVDNRTARDIRFAIHTGDVVDWDDDGARAQYQVGADALSPLNGVLRYALALGNHDTHAVGPAGGGARPGVATWVEVRNTKTFNSYFPVSRFPGITTYEAGKVDNAYQTFTAAGRSWLVLSLELWPRQQVIDWAKTVVANHPNDNVIIDTHSYLTGSGGAIEQTNGGYGSTSPQKLYNDLVSQYPNIKLVLSGHAGYIDSRTDITPKGNKVVSLMGTVHPVTDNPLQLLEIDVAKGTVNSQWYVPSTGQTMSAYTQTYSGLSFVAPASVCTALSMSVLQTVNPTTNSQLLSSSASEISGAVQYGFTQPGLSLGLAAPASGTGLVEVRRMYNATTNMFAFASGATDIAALKAKGFAAQGIQFWAPTAPASCTVAVERWTKNGAFRTVTDQATKNALPTLGWTKDTSAGVYYIKAPTTVDPVCKALSTPVLQTVNPTTNSQLLSSSASEISGAVQYGFTQAGQPLGLAAPASGTGLVEVHRMFNATKNVFAFASGAADLAALKAKGFADQKIQFWASSAPAGCTVAVERWTKSGAYRTVDDPATKTTLAAQGWTKDTTAPIYYIRAV